MTRYYSTQRPVSPGTYPKPQGNEVVEIHNFDGKTYCEELGREAWGYITYELPLATELAASYELTPEGVIWYPVTVSSRKHGGGLFVKSGMIVRSKLRPEDTRKETPKMQLKTRYFKTWEEAQRIMYALQSLDITAERVAKSDAMRWFDSEITDMTAEEEPDEERTFTVTEFCPHCETEVSMHWNTDTQGFKAFCPSCGQRLMLCDECHQLGGGCDYSSETDSCKFNPAKEEHNGHHD